MKKLIVICLVISGIATAIPASAQTRKHGEDSLHQAFSSKNQDDASNGVGFSLGLRHVEKGKYIAPGSIKALQIFPVNTVTGGFTYNFS